MTNEAILVQQLEERFFEATIADGSVGSTILKGSVMKFDSDPNTVAVSTADSDVFAGILIADKVNGNGVTRVALGRHGVYALKCSSGGTAVLGAPVKIDGANLIDVADDDTIENSGQIIGQALETGGNNEVVQVLVGGN